MLKLADKILEANEAALEWSDAQRQWRHGSLAMNVVQQGRIPFGRGLDPFTDGDYQAQHDIELILNRLERKAEVIPEQQHQLLTPVARPDSDAVLAEIAKIANVVTHPTDAEFRPGDAASSLERNSA